MSDLIKINFDSDRPTVSGRDLHEFLEVKTAYKDWFPRMCEYGFTAEIDFCSFLSESTGGRPAADHQLTIDMAKELSMIQRTEKGKLARQYFIQLEKAWNSPEQVMARALQMADRTVASLTGKVALLEETVESQRGAVLFADAVKTSHTTILIGELAKLLKQNGVSMGQNRLFEWMRRNGYLISRKGTDYNMPSQRSMELGLFSIKETVITHADGHTSTNKTPKVTGKGQRYFIEKFLMV